MLAAAAVLPYRHPMRRLLSLTLLLLAMISASAARAAEAPYRHVVLFKFKDDAPRAEVVKIEQAFVALKAKIPQIQSLEWGTNVSPEGLANGFTHCFFVTFADEKGRDAYLPHPAHKEFVEIVKPLLDDVCVVDYHVRN